MDFKKYGYLDCRDLGHAWETSAVVITQATPLVFSRDVTCMRCKTVRRDEVGRSYGNYHNYFYPDDYRLGRLSSDERMTLRLTNLKRLAD